VLPGTNKSLWNALTIPNEFKTIFIQSENSKAGTIKRIKSMLKGKPQYSKTMDNLYFPWVRKDCRISGNLLDPSFQSFLKEFTLTTGAKVLIFDPLISFHQGNENDNSEMRRALDVLTRICIDTETSPIVVHHTGKSVDRGLGGRGASAIGDWGDNILKVEYTKTKEHLVITHQKSRNFQLLPKPLFLELTGTLDFKRCYPEGKASEDRVREALAALGGTAKTQQPLAEEMEKLSLSHAKAIRLIKKAVKSGLVEEVRQGKAVSYQLTTDD
jgi:hypothetical protein